MVSRPYYETISFSGLPKRNVDYFDFKKYEDFDRLENNIDIRQDELNLANVKELTCPTLWRYDEIQEYIKD